MGGKKNSSNKPKKGNNSSKKGGKKAKKDREKKNDIVKSSRAEEKNNVNDTEPGTSLSKKEKRREKKKKTSNETSSDHIQSVDTSSEVTEQQPNTNSENLDANPSSPKDDSVNPGNTPEYADKPSTSQDSQQKVKLETKEASTSGTESTEKSNKAKSKKTDNDPFDPLEDFLVKPNQTYKCVAKKTISSLLSQVPKLEFKSLNQQQVERCIQWIIEKSNSSSVTDEQGLYLCAVLGHLAVTTSPDKRLILPNGETTTRACGTLLGCLVKSFSRKMLSPACNTLLEAIAPVLIDYSSSTGWLAFAAHFYPLFGMKCILEMNIVSPKYEEDNYMQLVHLLLSHQIPNIRKAPPEDQQCYEKFLKKILKLAPDEGTLFQLFANNTINRFFYTSHERETFCIEFYKDVGQTISGKSVSISEKLQQLNYLPKNLRGQLSGVLYAYLLEFIKSVEKPSSKDLEHFMNLQLSLRLNQDQIHTILMLISTSETVPYRELLLQLLKDNRFRNQWQQLQRTTKNQICVTWIKSKVHANEVSKVYQAAEELTSCPLVKSINGLDERLLNSIREWLIQNVEPEIIFQQLKDLEKFTVVVRESCLALVKDVFCEHLHIVNDKRLLSQFSQSSFFTRILFYALDKLQIPDQKRQFDSEDVFEKMLPWCEIWTTILRAKDRIKRDPKFQKGKEIWQNLGTCITSGNVSISFLKLVERHKSVLSFLFAELDVGSELHINPQNVKTFLDRIEELVEIEKNARKNMSLLESAIKFALKLPNISGKIAFEFNLKRGSLGSVKLGELNNEYWRHLLPLLKLSSSLQPIMQSFTFRNVAQVCLQEKNSENPHTVSNDVEHEMTWLFNFLSTTAVQRFEAEWKRVLRDPDLQTVETMKTLLGNPGDPRHGQKFKEEFATVKEYFKLRFLNSQRIEDYVGDYMKYPRVLMQVDNLIRLLETLGIMKSGNTLVTTLTSFEERFKYDETIVLKDLHVPLFKVDTIISRFMDKIDDVIVELGQSGELVSFLKEIVNEDIRVLIDAVEEHSDQYVSVSLVSDLIQIHGFLAPLLKKCQRGFPPDLILMNVIDECEKHPNMSMKIRQCRRNVHSLKGLYQNVANREEMTKEIISNCLNKGVFNISLDDKGVCKIIMSYKKNVGNTSTEKFMSELHDLRSRAHLIISSDKKAQELTHHEEPDEEPNETINYAEFIEQVNILSEIEEAILKLQSSGYIKYESGCRWPTIKGTKHLQDLHTTLHEELCLWEESLHDARQQNYFLNYYWSDQLCMLYNFLTNLDRTQVDFEEVLTLIYFVDPTINKQSLRTYGETHSKTNPRISKDNPPEIVSIIGSALDDIFTNTRPILRDIIDDMIPLFQPPECNASVQKGELYVVVLHERSPLTVNVMLSLYENTTNGYPEPYQVTFCSPNTAWEEIQLLLQRCFSQTTYLTRESLFCLANVELLANEVQFKLVDFIKKQDSDLDYQLAVICRGGDHHHIVEEFSKFRHSISGMSYPEVCQRLKSTWPDVKCVTSTLPGLGKTEFIRQEVQEKGRNVVTFPISGQLDQGKIIQRLKQLDLKHLHCLHFDIGEVDDPVLLDTFLFQLIVTGMVSYGTQLYSLRNTHVYIEISNSLDDRLRESLVITRCFTCVELQWNDYDDLLVSSKITSNIQVVCQYLDAYDRNRLERIDIHFFGQQKNNPLPPIRCRELLRKHYSTDADTTFTALNTFLGILANQLRKFSRSAYFEIANLKDMLEDASGIRKNLLKALLDVSKDFAARSLKTCSSSNSQQEVSGTSAQHMVQRVEGMIRWEESNHLLIVFHGVDSQTIAAFYRDKDRVPQNVSDLLRSQMVNRRINELDDFNAMSHEELHGKLERIARTKSRKQEKQETAERKLSGYALTPDNMLKMILIILRVRANVPIIIMGETGCGKTSLVEYLARTCEIPFSTYNFHAGRTEQEVKEFIESENDQAWGSVEQRWVFLDEINTCHHLGLINEIMCHHTLYGRPLSKKLVLLAACNPYKLRPDDNATTAGLEGKNKTDEYSKLVYRVHQLPEAMVDYVWDYGSLTPQDEKAYIRRMVQKLPTEYQDVLVDLLAQSQRFIRESERNPFCVSLRDVHRCILLVEWFMDMIKKRAAVMNHKEKKRLIPKRLEEDQKLAQKYDRKPVIKSIVLALAHCYLSRLQTEEMRRGYRECMTQMFSCVTSEKVFSAIIRMEQEDYLDRMELPPGTARNAALRENVFVMLVSILNRIPVFVVGKPGCSKSLSIQLIRSNLRGKDSKDQFFKTLPHLYVVSYQGSESSTSDGINKIFEIASKYKDHNKDANVLPVVLLDEVGLAENSPNNPLKVLHSILEPGKGKLPDVAVVGVSNWALDAAKMNRAIHLSRPEPTAKDLNETAISLYHANSKSRREIEESSTSYAYDVLNSLANAYHEYQSQQAHANFHGLRDYYSLVKSLHDDNCNNIDQINVALQRNFGGIPKESSKVQEIFIGELKSRVPKSDRDASIPVITLIQENLADPKARHLMLITNGDSAIGILKQNLSQSVKETVTIFGSRFEEDMYDDYNYRMLSRIILCMERDCVLILRDLECIYGSLYDMLNQNYAVVGQRYNCRVALGAYSNPICYVNDGFRCVVLVDYDKVDYSDPPFLNRFEKQLLRFSDVLNEQQQEIIAELQSWVCQMSSGEELSDQFKESDMFMGFHEDTLPSLVLLHSNDTDEPNEIIVKKCKDNLMWIATPDGVLRTQKCQRLEQDSREVKKFAEEYFEKPIHNGLASFIWYVLHDQGLAYSTGGEVGSKIIVMTYATVHTDINKCLNDTTTYQLERLGAYKSEKQLEDKIHYFFSSGKELLILQCKPELDGEHMLLARSMIEDKRKSYERNYRQSNSRKPRKHVCIIVHVHRAVEESTVRWQFNFLSGWKQVFLDALEVPSIPVNEMRTETIDNLLSSSVWSFQRFAEMCILWCFNCIKYTQNARQQQSILQITKNLFTSEKVTTAIQKIVLQHINPIGGTESEEVQSWQVKVACNIELLINSSTLSSAMEYYLSCLIRQPLAKIVYFLESENAWPPHLFSTDEDDMVTEYEDVWCTFLANSSIFNISDIPECQGAETYSVGGVRLELREPFSQVIFRCIDAAKNLVMKEYSQAMENKVNVDDKGELTTEALLKQLQRYSEILVKLVPSILQLPESCLSSYMADILEITSAEFNGKISSQHCISFSTCAFLSFAKQWKPIKDSLQFYALLHLFVWTSREQLNDLLQLVNWCQDFVGQKTLDLTKEFYLENQDILPFTENKPIDERFDVLRTKRKSSENDSEESDHESSDTDSSHGEESDSNDSDCSDSESSPSDYETDEEEEVEDEEVEDEKECFEDIFVTSICEKMFPSEKTVTKNGGLEPWMQNSTMLLSLAFKVNNDSPAFHFLRLCVDYAKSFVKPAVVSPSSLYSLHKISKDLKPEYLDADGSLQMITQTLIDPVEDQIRGDEEKHAVLQKFVADFFCRCIETNVETESARPIMEHIFSLGEDVSLMTPVAYRLLFAEECKSPGIFFDIIIDQSIDEGHSCLKDIDEVFRKCHADGSIHHDSYPAVMICDLICSIQTFDECFNIEQLKSSDSELLKCFRCATNVVTGGEGSIGLVLLASVAFLRAFFTMLSNRPRILTSETSYSHVMGEINSLLAVGGARRSSLQIFFLKQLYGAGMTMFDLRKLCCESEKLPVIKNQMEESKIDNKVELVSVYRLAEYKEVKDAYLNLNQQNESDMLRILKKCQNSANHRLALLGILVNMLYVKKAVGNLSENEERLADWFSVKSKELPSPLKELLQRIIGRGNFNHCALHISLESSTDEIETALLILHVSCVVASCVEGEVSPLFQYFFNPEKCHGTWILAQGEDRMRKVFDQFASSNDSAPVTCACNLRIKYQDDQEDNLCPHCKTKAVTSDSEPTSSDPIKSYFLEAKSREWEECTENMDASVFRSLDLIVHACLYAGVATGISPNKAVSHLRRPDQQGPTSTYEDSADVCFNRIKDDLQCLKTILSCKSRTAVDVMHRVVEECTALIQGKILSKDIFSTRKECLEWENEFKNIAQELLPEALGSARPLKETRMKFNEENEERPLIENQIQELDEYPSDFEQQNEELKRLFRVTKLPSFTELRSFFLNFPVFQEQHIVLGLLLSKFDELPYLACLFPLLQWTRLVSSMLTHRISRVEARSKFINDFIDGQILGQERNVNEIEVIRNYLKEFIGAWNKMRDFVNQELTADVEKMPFLMEHDCKLGYCLSEGDLSIYVRTAIKILQSIQNNILDELLLTSIRTRDPALSFLEKNETCCAIMSVSLQEAKEKDIINFDWSNEFIKYAQNPEYGYGENIDYDYEQMETGLTKKIAFGKCHLTESLNTFIFSKELFHSNAKVLTKVRELCAQSQSLPEEIREGLRRLKEHRIQDAQNLIQHIEVVIFVLNMQSTSIEQEMTMVDFANKWKSKLPTPFPVALLPEPKASIKLSHIATLYEALEDLLADGTIGGLPKPFRGKLKDETRSSLDGLVDSRNGSLNLQQFLTALRRFVFRYLSAEKYLPEPHTLLCSCLSEPSLWSPDEAPGPDVIPREMTLANIHDIITHLEQEQRGHSSVRTQSQRRNKVSTGRAGKRRVISSFSR